MARILIKEIKGQKCIYEPLVHSGLKGRARSLNYACRVRTLDLGCLFLEVPSNCQTWLIYVVIGQVLMDICAKRHPSFLII